MRRTSRDSVRRILMTADAVGGVWTYAIDLSAALRRRGVHVTLAVLGPAPSGAQRLDAKIAGVDLEHAPYRLEWMEDAWDDVRAAGEWLLALEASVEPDIVHLNGYCHAALPWSCPAIVVGHSCVLSWWRAVHGVAAPPEWDHYRNEVARGLAAAALVVAPTGAMLNDLRTHYGPVNRAVVIPNGRAGVDAPTGEQARSPMVLTAGRAWDPAKNIAAVCSAASMVSCPVMVAGQLAAPGGAAVPTGDAIALGCLPPEELNAWYRRAAIYALPARYEPFGLSVLEAASAGCALILGDIGSLRENWSGAAEFVPPGQSGALVDAIEALLRDPSGLAAQARRAKARAAQFTSERMAASYLTAYHGLLLHAAA